MNKIKASVDTSDYEDRYNFLNFQIDGFWLDEKLEEFYPGKNCQGLVPTLSFWLESDEEKEVVWSRILPAVGEKTICPILMCPDDCDFNCTLLVVEIENWREHILWNRIGMDHSTSSVAEQVGSKVEWFYKIGSLQFLLKEYLEMLKIFKDKYDEEEALGE